MSDPAITNKSIVPGELVVVKGKLSFSRLAKQIAGDDLIKDNQRRVQRGMSPIDRPYTSVTIDQAVIIPKTNGQLTATEIYLQNRFYTSKSRNAQGGMSYTAMNKSSYLPHIGLFNAQTEVIDEIALERDLASGLDVVLVMRGFAGKQGNNGVSLDWVIIPELRYYAQTGGIDSILSLIGATAVNPLSATPKPVATATPVPAVAANAFASTVEPEPEPVEDEPLPFDEPQQNGYSAPVMGASPFASAPAQAPAQQPIASPFGGTTGGIVARPFGQ